MSPWVVIVVSAFALILLIALGRAHYRGRRELYRRQHEGLSTPAEPGKARRRLARRTRRIR